MIFLAELDAKIRGLPGDAPPTVRRFLFESIYGSKESSHWPSPTLGWSHSFDHAGRREYHIHMDIDRSWHVISGKLWSESL